MSHASSRRAFLAAGLALPAPAAAPASAAPGLEFRPLGKTGLKVTSLGFGCMLASDAIVLERAADIGINYFDTARIYQGGNNERMVGAALKGKRHQVVLSSKTMASGKEDALRDLDTSLRELGTDYLDIWYLHSKNEPDAITDDLLEAQRAARQAGKIRFRGVTFHFNMPQMLEHTLKLGCFDVALASYNFTMQPDVGQAIAAARKQGLGVVAMKVMAGGYARIRRGDRLYGQDPGQLTGRLEQPGAMLAALKWTLRNRAVDSAIIGMTSFDELDENLRAMSEPLRPQEEKLLAERRAALAPLYCRMCGACGGVCEKGVRVADSLRCLTYAEGYGQFALARDAYLSLPAGARPERCGDCGRCSVACPNGVQVRERLLRAGSLLA